MRAAVEAEAMTFSKRRKGVFKKVEESAVLYDVNVALIVFFATEKLFQFSSSPRSGIGADMDSLSVSGIGYENPHISPECHPYLQFRKTLQVRENQLLDELIQLLQPVTLDQSKEDVLQWKWSTDKQFSVKSVYNQCEQIDNSRNQVLGSL
ncbi:hypothetical protein RHMOL_Rhmol05G0217100 [Rhododendron molle]|uniref:Uncharacterized protein n=1 Tax=Rhododendron molle TaxID=49168 RepID=A0ACC0NTQ4_RHOML|nr:hypothetical protein RHMOL_Rhmol05G0217100 [Rhododendron molle]